MAADQTGTASYAKCLDCDAELATPAAASEHSSETLLANPDFGTGRPASSHRYRVVNPTAEQVAQRRVRSAVDYAIDEMFLRLDEEIRRREIPQEEVTRALAEVDLGDAWTNWLEEDA